MTGASDIGSDSGRFVSTKAAQEATEGREVEIVQAIGIPWQAGQREHIRCPYPDHGGANDWRLTPKGRAICTCTGGKTDSVFDIVGKVEGIDFEAAKIRCVEIVGRSDLIRTTVTRRRAYLSTDAESLLSAPVEGRQDTLPSAYLAHRLGIERDAVPMPATPAIGLASLAYFDAPKGGKGKPPKVGNYPCAVFGQVDALGRRHAHRIYLAPEGRGKADLGVTAAGAARDPKKSAKAVDEDSTAGRAVLWGDADAAPWAILCEGIETAAAVAYAFREEIKRGEAYVAAGVHAGGVEAFEPWPATKRVTVAADRDEAIRPGKTEPSRRGEHAARLFGVRQGGRIAVSIALPGNSGESIDWLDIHAATGPDAVRSGILEAAPFSQTAEEIDAERERLEGYAEIKEISGLYPLPSLSGLSLTYRRTKAGKVWVHKVIRIGSDLQTIPVASPIGIPRRLAYLGGGYGLRIAVQDMRGQPRFIDVRRADLAKPGVSDIRGRAYEAGLRVEDDGESIVVQLLKAADPDLEVQVVPQPGWHEIEGFPDPLFTCPDGTILGAPAGSDYELAMGSRLGSSVAQGGTMEGWLDAVTAAVGLEATEHWTLAACAAFAGVLVGLTGLGTRGINLSGLSSTGKSTAQRIAVSAWSTPDVRKPGLAQSAKSTVNAMEALAGRANGTILSLDELAHVRGSEVARMIYTFAGETGRQRMNADAELRACSTWSTFVILSSECSLEEKVRSEDGGDWAVGMAARFADIDVSTVNRSVDRATMDRIEAVTRHFGHAGPAFVRALIEHRLHREGAQLRDAISARADRIAGPDASAQQKRAALSFAFLAAAGEMAVRFGILPPETPVAGSIDWAWRRFMRSSDARVLSPEEQVTESLRAAIASSWGVTIRKVGPVSANREAHGWYDADAVYLLREKLRSYSGNTLTEDATAELLSRQGLLVKQEADGRLYTRYVKGVGKVQAYAFSRNEFGREHDSPDDVDVANDFQRRRGYGT